MHALSLAQMSLLQGL